MNRAFLLAPLLAPVLLFAQAKDSQDGPWKNVLANLKPRSIGPTNMGGRCTDLAVYNKDPRIFFVASASGGLWKTENAGITFTPTFDQEGSVSIGAAAISQTNPDVVWVGSGEGTSRNSVAWGNGVYKSIDGGKTWKNMGLKETMHISRVLIDPRDNDTVYVGSLGRLWGENPERGVYKTTDGGKHWDLVFHIDNQTGVADLQMNPKNPNELLCAMWPRRRWAFDFISGGPTAGLYKSADAGKTWKRVLKGLPMWPDASKMTKDDLVKSAPRFDIRDPDKMSESDLRQKVQQAMSKNPLPYGRIGMSYYRKDPKIVLATVEYAPPVGEAVLGRAGDMNGGSTFMSKDSGDTWARVNSLNPRPFYFSRPQIDPNDPNRLYIGGVNLHVSDDMGKTFRTARASIHADIHQIWVDPNDSNHLLVACDGGLYQSRDKAVKWEHLNTLPIGQFYDVAFDSRKPYWVFGGLQDNGTWGQPTQTVRGVVSWYDVIGLGDGDGFHVASDPNDWRNFYSESQGGFFTRFDLKTGAARGLQPNGSRVEGNTNNERYRFNWSTPFIISPHNSTTLYLGGNKLFKSVNRGDRWKAISADLTTNDPNKLKPHENTGAENHCTIITISESPTKQGLIYVGTDDGLVWVTRDDGGKWENLTANIPELPANTWCSRVTASKFSEGRVFATFDGHRANDFKPYVYTSEDYGKTWTKLSAGLPDFDNIYTIKEGDKNDNLLFLGSEMSLRVSLDRGKTWSRLHSGFPTVAVHDVSVNAREGDLVIATHGRSLWTMDINGLEAMTKDAMDVDVTLVKPQAVYLLGMMTGTPWDGDQVYQAANTQPGALIQYWLKKDQPGELKINVMTADGLRSQELTGSGKAGLNTVYWNGRILGRLVTPGDYRITMTVAGKEYVTGVHAEDVSQ